MKALERKPPSRTATEQAKVALRVLAALPRKRSRAVVVRPEGGDEVAGVTVPYEAFALFLEVLGEMANGNAVTIVPIHADLTTQQAADLLNVSRPYLVQLLDEQKLPSRKVGAHRRVRAADVVAFRQSDDRERQDVLRALAAEAQKHGLGY